MIFVKVFSWIILLSLVACVILGVAKKTGFKWAAPKGIFNDTSDILWVVGGFVFLFCLGWYISPEHWMWNNVLATTWFPLSILGFVLFSIMVKKDKNKPFKHNMAWILFFGTLAFVVWIVSGAKIQSWWNTLTNSPTYVGVSAGSSNQNMSHSIALITKECDLAVQRFWKENLSEPESSIMIEHAWLESNCSQFASDGEVRRVVPQNQTDDATAMGVMMVKKSLWGEEALKQGFDLETLDGNLEFSLWLINMRKSEGKRFDVDWDATTPPALREIEAPVGGRSEAFSTLRYEDISPRGPITIWDEHGQPHYDTDDGVVRRLPPSSWFQVESATSTPVIVDVVR